MLSGEQKVGVMRLAEKDKRRRERPELREAGGQQRTEGRGHVSVEGGRPPSLLPPVSDMHGGL